LNEAKAEYEYVRIPAERGSKGRALAEELADPNDCPVYLKEPAG